KTKTKLKTPKITQKLSCAAKPLILRAITIHGDGCYNKLTGATTYYQESKNIHYFEALLTSILSECR
ncbi:MAG: hypothetical protein ACE5FT_05425, partial [Candidatus Nanoarchaeia archaeon]